jgi:hypothetical protein
MKRIKTLGLGISLLALGSAVSFAQQQPAAAEAAPSAAPAAAPTAPAPAGPKLQFATPVFDFGKTRAGDPVKHVFYFTNTGDATLELSNVRPGCGCTTTGEWTKKVEPGQTGSIPIQVATVNFNGPVVKTVTVDSNDKAQPSTVLQIKGTIWKPVEVNPQMAYFNVVADTPGGAQSIVRIINNTDEPMTLSEPEVNNKNFTTELKTVQPNKEYQLIVKTDGALKPGSLQGQVTIKTSSTNMPVINVTAFANVQPVVSITPPQVTLLGGPLANQTRPNITIQVNGTNTAKLSDATVLGAQNVEVQLAEPQPGKVFTATLNFPQGFQIAQGQQIEFTAKTTLPQFPVIKVPVIQMAPPPQPLQPITAPAPVKTPTSGLAPAPGTPGSVAGAPGH